MKKILLFGVFLSLMAVSWIGSANTAKADSVTLLPSGTGHFNGWIPSQAGASHFSMVNENPCDGDQTYNYTGDGSGASGPDGYQLNANRIPNGSIITAVYVSLCAAVGSATAPPASLYASFGYNAGNLAFRGNRTVSSTNYSIIPAISFTGLNIPKDSSSYFEISVSANSPQNILKLSRALAKISYIPPTPNTPTNLSATLGTSSVVSLSWVDNSNNETGFYVERGTDGINFAQIASVAANTTRYYDANIVSGQTYHYRVRAYAGSAKSDYSNTVTVPVP